MVVGIVARVGIAAEVVYLVERVVLGASDLRKLGI